MTTRWDAPCIWLKERIKALLVDTGVQEGKILPMLKSLTDKPISLALTHAHIDRMYHADEFEEVFLHERDIKAWHGGIMYASGTGYVSCQA